MFNRKQKIQAGFFRNSGVECIEVYLPGVEGRISIFAGIADLSSNSLGEKEIAKVIDILSHKKEAMLKRRNFPQTYDEMLTELIDVQRKRYGVKKDKKRRVGYSVSGGKLEEILGEYYKIKDVHIYSIDVGNNRDNAAWISLKESDDRYLAHLSFREVEEDV